MKNLMTIFLFTAMLGTVACSSTRDTKRANPDANVNEPMRKKSQTINNSAGHQKDEIRQETR